MVLVNPTKGSRKLKALHREKQAQREQKTSKT
nr:MAG TPA: hypothetical protein [Caudoviricetes sp.]